MGTRQANVELAMEQKARAAGLDGARGAQEAARQALQAAKSAHRDAEGTWSRQVQEVQIELATQRERTTGADLRATDLASQLQRQQEQSEREISQLRESLAATAAALRQLEARGNDGKTPPAARLKRSLKNTGQ